MNVIITLPTKLANLIYEGQKTIEVRKNWPKLFDLENDVVYICEKGTGLVTGMIIIDDHFKSNDLKMVWYCWNNRICIDEQDYFNYVQDAKEIHLWHISVAERFIKPYSLKNVFCINSAPQSYVYSDIGWSLNSDLSIEIETSDKKAVQ